MTVTVIWKGMVVSRLRVFAPSLVPIIRKKYNIRTPINFGNCFQEVSCSTNLYEEQHAPHHRRVYHEHLLVTIRHVRSWDPFHSRPANQYTFRSPFISCSVNSINIMVNLTELLDYTFRYL